MALRLQLWLDLPLSNVAPINSGHNILRQFVDVLRWTLTEPQSRSGNFRFGSVAVVKTENSQMSGLEWKADVKTSQNCSN